MSQETSTPADQSPATDEVTLMALRRTATTLNRKWAIKMWIIALVTLGLAAFFLIDGTIRYPQRGMNAAEYIEYQYLDLLNNERGSLSGVNGIDDPVARLAQLENNEKTTGKLDPAERLQKDWLENLKLVSKLIPEATAIPRINYKDGLKVDSAAQRLEELRKSWTTRDGTKKKSPTPLSAFDIPSQWAGLAVCLVVGIWILWVLASASEVYRWDLATLTLSLPDGATLTPADIEEVDKRKWDKLFVALRIKSTHPTVGGKLLEFDLLRHEPLEAWILEMERTAFPDSISDAPTEVATVVDARIPDQAADQIANQVGDQAPDSTTR